MKIEDISVLLGKKSDSIVAKFYSVQFYQDDEKNLTDKKIVKNLVYSYKRNGILPSKSHTI